MAGSPRAGGGGGTGLPKSATPPPSGSRGFPAGRSPRRCAGDRRPPGPLPRGWCSARDAAFSRRGGRVTAVTPPPLPLATCGFSGPGKGRAPQGPQNPAPLAGLRTPLFARGSAPAGTCGVATLIEIQAGPVPAPGGGRGVRGARRSRRGLRSAGRVGARTVPGGVAEGLPQGLPRICSSSPLPWVPEVTCVAGTGGSWELGFPKLLPPRLTCP